MVLKKKSTRKRIAKSGPPFVMAPGGGHSAVTGTDEALFREMRRGSEPARDELLAKYAHWASNIARKYHALFPGMDLSELEAEGNRGLLEAAGKYDPSRKTKFSTYSWFWIIKNIQEYITSSINLIGVPANVMSNLRKVMAKINDGIKRGENPSLRDISRTLGIEESMINDMLSDKRNISSPLSLDMYINDEDRQETLGDIVEDKKHGGIKEMLDSMEDKKFLGALMERLSPIEGKVIKMRYGIGGGKTMPPGEIGRVLKISPMKVRDIETIVLIKLKHFMEEQRRDRQE